MVDVYKRQGIEPIKLPQPSICKTPHFEESVGDWIVSMKKKPSAIQFLALLCAMSGVFIMATGEM